MSQTPCCYKGSTHTYQEDNGVFQIESTSKMHLLIETEKEEKKKSGSGIDTVPNRGSKHLYQLKIKNIRIL